MQFLQHAIALKIYSCVEKDIVKNRTDCFLFKLLTYFFMGVGPLWGMGVGCGNRALRGRQLCERMVKNGSVRLFIL